MGVENCIAIQFLYCREEGLSRLGLYYRIVLQEGQVYCNTVECRGFKTVLQYSLVGSRFVSQYKLYCEPKVGLCRDIAWARQLGAQRPRGARRWAQAGARCWACWRWARRLGAGARGVGRAGRLARGRKWQAGTASARGAGAAAGAWARGARPAQALGARAGQGCALGVLDLFSARFDSVLFLSQIFGHCS